MSWAVFELTPLGEKAAPGILSKEIRKYISGADVFVPSVEARVGDDQVTHTLMEGYAFVQEVSPRRPLKAYLRLEGTRYIHAVLCTGGKAALVEDSYVETMRERMKIEVNQGIGVGDTVEICSGPYKCIEASVIVDLPETKEVQVFVQLRSKQALLTLPRSVLKVVDRAPLSSYFARLNYLKAWAEMAKALVTYNPPVGRLQQVLSDYSRVSDWGHRGNRLYILFNESARDIALSRIKDLVQEWERVDHWSDLGRSLFSFVFFDHQLPRIRVKAIAERLQQLKWLQDQDLRIQGIGREVETLARSLAYEEKQNGDGVLTVQNVIVDGHNLMHRCFHAPGMSSLKSPTGQPTGVIVGFLRSLGALQKRFPEARFWVTWDGSSQRRLRLFRDYKAGRKKVKFLGQDAILRGILPLLGVEQAWNPEEEADDIVATLVRGALLNQKNLIFSTDRDFLQLVTEDTLLLTPAIGARKEVLFDPERVVSLLGVPPERVVELRAFFGDKSDNLPGVPRVPKKVLKALLAAHGSLQGVYASGLAGLNKGQYERLRTAESQVRINYDIMSLSEVSVSLRRADVDADKAFAALQELGVDPRPILKIFLRS